MLSVWSTAVNRAKAAENAARGRSEYVREPTSLSAPLIFFFVVLSLCLAAFTDFELQCDQVKPVCSQCIRANRICPGYRDQLSLLFRDESQEVIRKARAASSSGKQTRGTRRRQHARNDAKEPATGDFSSDGSDRRQLRYSPLVEQPVSTSAKDQATCLFFRNFGWMGASFLARADSRYSHSQTVEAPVSNKAMLASIAAVGMAALAGIKNSPPLRLAARSEYVQALRYTNAALSDPTQATSDATLTSVSLLAIFEVRGT